MLYAVRSSFCWLDDILRHYDVIGKECPYYFVKHPDAWEGLLNSLTYASVF